jgi:hypothetical protein
MTLNQKGFTMQVSQQKEDGIKGTKVWQQLNRIANKTKNIDAILSYMREHRYVISGWPEEARFWLNGGNPLVFDVYNNCNWSNLAAVINPKL